MKKWILLTVALTFLGVSGCAAYIGGPEGPPPPSWHTARPIEVSDFYEDMAPYGDWLWVEPWGWVWTPWDVEPGWRPYTHGRWAWTSLGWTWISDYSWGWAPFHYGRWTYHSHYGWLWVPDTVWAPAWVAWRAGHGWVGWAPLPPGAHWRMGFGLDLGGLDLMVSIVPHGWCFVDEHDFLRPRIWRHLAPLPRHSYLFRETEDRTRYAEVDRRVAVRSIDVEEIERNAGPVPRERWEDVEKPPRGAIRKETPGGGTPELRKPEQPEKQPAPLKPPQSMDKVSPDRRAEQELRELKEWEQKERARLEEEQKKELRKPQAEETRPQIQQRQEEERRDLQKEVEREKKLVDSRRDRRIQEEKPKASEPKVEPKKPVKKVQPKPPGNRA